MAKKFIQAAIKHPGALRATARHKGLIRGNEKLSQEDLGKIMDEAMKLHDTTTMHRVNLAKILKKMH